MAYRLFFALSFTLACFVETSNATGRFNLVNVILQHPDQANTSRWVDPESQPSPYELLLGHPLEGVVRPRVILECRSADSVVDSYVVFRIRSMTHFSAAPVYQKTMLVDPTTELVNDKGSVVEGRDPNRRRIPKGAMIRFDFDPFVTNPLMPRHLDRFAVDVIYSDRSFGGQTLDTTVCQIQGIRRTELGNVQSVSRYEWPPSQFPNLQYFTSFGANVVSVEAARGPRRIGQEIVTADAVRLDRRAMDGTLYSGTDVGDTLVSAPVDLSRAYVDSSFVSFVVIPARKKSPTDRIGLDATETRGTRDRLIVEFEDPYDGSRFLTNPTELMWSNHRLPDGSGLIRGVPALQIYPGGEIYGHDPASPNTPQRERAGVRVVSEEAWEHGVPFLVVVRIPRWYSSHLNGNKTFRYRVRLAASAEPKDDDDVVFLTDFIVNSELDWRKRLQSRF